MRKSPKAPAAPAAPPREDRRYVVTDPIAGHVCGRAISHVRGDIVRLSPDEAKVFKDRILEIEHGLHL
jgi:hypothetical protein